MSPPNETDVQFLARIMWEFSGSAGYPLTVDDTAHLHDLAYHDTPAPVEEREGVIPEGAEEFVSKDGFRSLQLSNGTVFRVRGSGSYEYHNRFGPPWLMVPRAHFNPESEVAPWISSVWAEMRDEPKNESARSLLKKHNLPEPSQERQAENLFQNTGIGPRDEPKERGDGDALDALRSVCTHLSDENGYVAFSAIEAIESARARNAEEVARLREQLKMELEAGVRGRNDARARIAELEATINDYEQGQIALDLLFDELDMRKADPAGDEELVRDVISRCRDTESRAEKAEAEAAELRERVKSLYGQLDRIKSEYDNLAGGGPDPGFGVDPKDSSRLSDLLACIDTHGIWPSEEAEDAGDYEAAIRHMGEVCQERVCLFSETVRFDWQSGVHFTKCLPKDPRFSGKHVEATFRALYPIGAPAEVSKPEGRDS